ncbi:hypothetical protein [Sediminibacillus massiliensis]|uniref:hypothetical protein n=1 Tax=Sediminibacillus massiliensis TaxID=1926277 RepID=UPI000988664A|nr:hypothetical protein [Sediminibacillus massiliensis]
MKEITSYQINLKHKMTTQEIVALYRYASKSSHDIYLYQQDQIADTANFPKLMSFFLVASDKQPIVVIIDGENPNEVYKDFSELLRSKVEKSKMRNHHTVKSSGISIVI